MIYLETERLVLRDWREEDSVVFSRMNRDPKVMEYFLKPLTDTESRDFYERIRREIDTFGWGLFAAEVKISGKFIGYIGFFLFGIGKVCLFARGYLIKGRFRNIHITFFNKGRNKAIYHSKDKCAYLKSVNIRIGTDNYFVPFKLRYIKGI